ncbi:MAG: hypothetical protein OXI11_02570 [Gammaproteobacteria bacterium]|nr:hypothetical protein [Gammaproteobacteria bacterium]
MITFAEETLALLLDDKTGARLPAQSRRGTWTIQPTSPRARRLSS